MSAACEPGLEYRTRGFAQTAKYFYADWMLALWADKMPKPYDCVLHAVNDAGEGMKMSKRFRIIFATSCAILCMMLCVLYADHVSGEAERVRSEAIERYGGEVVSLVVTSCELEPGDVVSQSNVVTCDWLADLAPVGAITNLDDVLGLEVSEPAPEGAPLTEMNFREVDVLSDVPSGHVALTLSVNDNLGISSNVPKGSKLVAYQVEEDGTTLVATDMEVLSSPSESQTFGTTQVTVAVLPTDVAKVLSASASNDLRLVMPADDVTDEISPTQPPEELPEVADEEVSEADEAKED